MSINKIPPEILLCISEQLDQNDIGSLSKTCSRMSDVLARLKWSHVCIDFDSANISTNPPITVTEHKFHEFIESSQAHLQWVKSLTLKCNDRSAPQLYKLLSSSSPFSIPNTITRLNIISRVSNDDTFEFLHSIAGLFACELTLDIQVNHDWCAPDYPLISNNTTAITIRNTKCNDLTCLLDNLVAPDSQLPCSLSFLALRDERIRRSHYATPAVDVGHLAELLPQGSNLATLDINGSIHNSSTPLLRPQTMPKSRFVFSTKVSQGTLDERIELETNQPVGVC